VWNPCWSGALVRSPLVPTSAVGRWLSAWSSSGLSNPPMGGRRAHVGVLSSRDSDFHVVSTEPSAFGPNLSQRRTLPFAGIEHLPSLYVWLCSSRCRIGWPVQLRLPQPRTQPPSARLCQLAGACSNDVQMRRLGRRDGRFGGLSPTYLSRAGFNLNPLGRPMSANQRPYWTTEPAPQEPSAAALLRSAERRLSSLRCRPRRDSTADPEASAFLRGLARLTTGFT
jgi:hypothetical protein